MAMKFSEGRQSYLSHLITRTLREDGSWPMVLRGDVVDVRHGKQRDVRGGQTALLRRVVEARQDERVVAVGGAEEADAGRPSGDPGQLDRVLGQRAQFPADATTGHDAAGGRENGGFVGCHDGQGIAGGASVRWQQNTSVVSALPDRLRFTTWEGEIRVGESGTGPAVLVEQVTKSFGDVHALRGIDLVIPSGTVLGVLGPNGAGKTTGVRILTTLLEPDGGRAVVEGHDVVREAAAVRRCIGLAGQSAAIQEELTGRQ